jgi:hypothetical protein
MVTIKIIIYPSNFLKKKSNYCRIWQNVLMDNCHLSNITKLREKKKKKKTRENDEKEPAKNSTFCTGNGI